MTKILNEIGNNPDCHSMALEDRLIRDVDGAAILGCSKATFWRRVADGTLPQPLKIGGLSRWKSSDIFAVIEHAAKNRAG